MAFAVGNVGSVTEGVSQMYRECDHCEEHITLRYSAMEPFEWDEHYTLEWTSGPEDERTKVIENEHGEQRFPNIGKWYFCSEECVAAFLKGGIQ